MTSVICMAFKKNWGYLFNNDPEVVAIVASIMPYIALFQVKFFFMTIRQKLTGRSRMESDVQPEPSSDP